MKVQIASSTLSPHPWAALRRVLQIAMAALIAVCLSTTVTTARADVIEQFTFDGVGFKTPTSVSATGSFTVDESTKVVESWDITVSSTTSSPPFTTTFSNLLSLNTASYSTSGGGGPFGLSFFAPEDPLVCPGPACKFSFLDLFLENNLTNLIDPILSTPTLASQLQVAIPKDGFLRFFDATGSLDPASVPEPPTLILLCGALGIFVLTRRAVRRRPAASPENPVGA